MDAYLLGVDCLKVRQIHCITLTVLACSCARMQCKQ
jgi:hypothetical protein